MIFRKPPKEPEVVLVNLQVIRLDDKTILLKVGGTSYHVEAGAFSLTLARGVEVMAEIVK